MICKLVVSLVYVPLSHLVSSMASIKLPQTFQSVLYVYLVSCPVLQINFMPTPTPNQNVFPMPILIMDCISLAGNVVLTSTVIEDERQFACEGEMVTFTCQVIGSASLQWHSPLICQIVYTIRTTDPVVSMPPFTATLTSIAGSGINSNFTSTLQVTASRMFAWTNTTVECRNQPGVNMSSRFTVAGNS